MNPRRWRLRTLLATGAVIIAFASMAVAGTLLSRLLRARLSTELPPAAVEHVMDGTRDAYLAVMLAACVAALLLGLFVGQRLARTLRRVRDIGSTRAPGGRRVPLADFATADIRSLAMAFDLAITELDGRIAQLAGERDDLRRLVDTVSEGILQVDADGRIVHANPAARTLLGLPASVRGQPFAAHVRSAELRALLERAAHGIAAGTGEVAMDERRLLVAARPVNGDNAAGSPVHAGAVVALADLTEIRRLESVRRDFVANVSHELKTPLTSIRGYAETLLGEADLPPDTRRAFLEIVHRNAERLQEIIDDLLDLSRLESGAWQPEIEDVDPLQIGRETWSAFSERAAYKRIEFNATGNGARVLADPSGLRHVLSNLYDNALRYTPDGGHITLAVRAEDTTQATSPAAAAGEAARATLVTLEVRDTGSGIPSDAIGRIFERFYRVDAARSRNEGGTGLGLSIVRHLVESMGGDVSAESELGHGAAFRVRLRAS